MEITKLKQRVKKLERRNKVKVLKLRRLSKVGTGQRVETSDDTVMDDVSNQGRMIAEMDQDADVVLEEAKEVGNVDNTDQDAKEEESVSAELQEVVDVVTTAKLITKVVTAASTTIIAADVPVPTATTTVASKPTAAPSRRTKEVVIRDHEETTTTSIIIHTEAKSKDKGKGILNEAQARKNMMIYLKNVAGFKIDYFKEMYYDDIRPIFEAKFNTNVAFLQKTKEQIEEEESRALKRLNETPAEKAAKRKKLDDEVEELKKHLQIVPNEEDDVYTEATPLARKVPVVDYEIINQNNKPYYKIMRADARYTCSNLENSKKCLWSIKSQELEAVGIMWCTDNCIDNNTADFVSREERCVLSTEFVVFCFKNLAFCLGSTAFCLSQESCVLSLKHCVLPKDKNLAPNGESLRKCILSGPYKPTTVLVQAVDATNDSLAILKHTIVETPMNMSPENKAHFEAEKEAIHMILTGIRDEIYSTVDTYQIAQEMWEAIKRLQQGESLNIQDVKTNLFWEFESQKRVKDFAYHKEKMLMCKQAEQGVPLQAEQYDWLADTDEEVDEQELEAHYSYMAKIQEVSTADTGIDSETLEKVQNDVGYNVFANDLKHYEQSESISNTCLVKTDDSYVTPDSPDMCEDDIQNDQNDVESDDEYVTLANLIANLKLDVNENKKIQKKLKKVNTTLAQELKECKTILAETSKSLRESISVWDSCLVALQTKQAG
uniref:Uncharacterized protein n=1 Tax=Tanacetum cinerariifolium TaxID=118510 RepID=A0A6L2MQG5_TANCI|nr:hypothetical protein [Tanacetum cinerariifolium]